MGSTSSDSVHLVEHAQPNADSSSRSDHNAARIAGRNELEGGRSWKGN